MSIQGSINSMLGSAARGIVAYKGYKELQAKNAAKALAGVGGVGTQAASGLSTMSPQLQAAQVAQMSANNEIQAKTVQKNNFMEYIKNQPTSLGKKVEDLPMGIQKQIMEQYKEDKK